ncbi:polyprenyl synthetase family protein [Streptomyces ficellus]|uniref:Polyprenyl synthetase family protein n=1 Tax=Streptomyces ficellus TaxID=1977088 RepID=A0A6I6F2Q2_9ACTN|nr:polyprenyl synthetase family protein [Streptomyces ficellus]QGV77051.1 polyprenyl synthetase family protein [Streptomyces ficellus]
MTTLRPPAGEDWLACPRTRAALTGLDAVLHEAATAEDPLLRMMAGHLLRRGGKRLRPALLVLSASYGTCRRAPLLRAAAALELVHIASLYHDDVMDRAPTRRDGTTVNARWGDELAALAGTYLFAQASRLLVTLGDEPNRVAAEAFLDVCGGQLQEAENAYNTDLGEAEHLRILARKTATLFELPCRLGTLLSQAPPDHAHALRSYGRSLGLAFQLTDDVLDLPGRGRGSGKSTGTDVREGVYCLTVLRAVRTGGDVGARLTALLGREDMTAEQVAEVYRLVESTDAGAAVLDLARSHATKALEALRVLPGGPERESLENLARHVLTRSR